MTTYKMVEVQIDLSDFETEALLQESVDRSQAEQSAPEVRSWLLEMLSPDLEPLLNNLYEACRGQRNVAEQERRLAQLFDITLGRVL